MVLNPEASEGRGSVIQMELFFVILGIAKHSVCRKTADD
jgi:hypothetical protein